jgi:isopenicillin-N epimerase
MVAPTREDFLLDPDVVFLNHGSFGACPRPVFAQYQAWQHEMERQPVAFLGRTYDDYMDSARSILADYVGCAYDSLIFVPNATVGINLVARSLTLEAGDEVLTTTYEYGAMDKLWEFVTAQQGAHYIHQPTPSPLVDAQAWVEVFWQGVTERTKVIFMSHITSPTALILPVAEICARARDAGILTVIDGAHAPGQIDLDLQTLGADFYTGNCHKWLCAPKNAGFLYADARHHDWLSPLIVSWGYGHGASFAQTNQWQGTQDVSAYLTVPSAIAYQEHHDWVGVRGRCHALACYTAYEAQTMTGIALPTTPDFFGQMVAFPLPTCDREALKRRLYDEFRVEVPVTHHGGRDYVRVSYQAYNTPDDADALLEALRVLLPQVAR